VDGGGCLQAIRIRDSSRKIRVCIRSRVSVLSAIGIKEGNWILGLNHDSYAFFSSAFQSVLNLLFKL